MSTERNHPPTVKYLMVGGAYGTDHWQTNVLTAEDMETWKCGECVLIKLEIDGHTVKAFEPMGVSNGVLDWQLIKEADPAV